MKDNDIEQIREFAAIISRSKRYKKNYGTEYSVPDVIGVKVTNRCNLRCRHCYEWNERGYHHYLDAEIRNKDIDLEIIEECIHDTKETKAMFYLWGGEPFIYPHVEELLSLLSKEERFTVICTNGLLIDKYEELICSFNNRIEILFALEGDAESNDALRGLGNFDKVINNIERLVSLKRDDVFCGTISVHTMVSNENITHLEQFVDDLEKVGIDKLILCFPWYISEKTSCEMDTYYWKNLHYIQGVHGGVPSWHAYKYRIMPENIKTVHQVINRLKEDKHSLNIRFQPDIKGEELDSFLMGESIENCSGRECLALYSRLDVLPTGEVTPCKHFQELSYGNLQDDSLLDLWNSELLKKIRNTLNEKQMPVCSKCNNLYQHSYQRIKE